MAQKEEQSTELAPEIRRILGENQRLKREIKGHLGQIAVLKAQSELSQVKPSPEKPAEAETKPVQAATPEFVRSYEKYCPDCGGPNADYVKPNLFCKGEKCGVPLGNFKTLEEAAKVKVCWNCGGTAAVLKGEVPA